MFLDISVFIFFSLIHPNGFLAFYVVRTPKISILYMGSFPAKWTIIIHNPIPTMYIFTFKFYYCSAVWAFVFTVSNYFHLSFLPQRVLFRLALCNILLLILCYSVYICTHHRQKLRFHLILI